MQGPVHLASSTIAVTGATGFLGGYLVAGLRARGARVIAVVRDREKATRQLGQAAEIRVADLADRTALARAFAGADAVISNAAVISFRSVRLTMRTNVEGTRNVFEAIAQAGVKRAVAISSSAAYPLSVRRSDESKPLRPLQRAWFGNVYGVSKAEGERVAWRVAEASGIALTTFRPCGITGPRDPLLMAQLERMMASPIALLPAGTAIGVVHAGDVVEAVVLALTQPERSAGRAYNLQGHTVTLWQLSAALQRAGGPAPRLRLPVPVPIALRYDDARARLELGWRPRSLDAILEEVVRDRRGV